MGKGAGDCDERTPMSFDSGAEPTARQRLLHWLTSLPVGHLLRWNEDSMADQWPVARGYVDINIPELCDHGLNFAWTLEEGTGAGASQALADPDALSFPVAYGSYLLVPDAEDAPSTLLADNRMQPIGVADDLWRAQAAQHGTRLEHLPGWRVRVWSATDISEALRDWTQVQTGRSDLQFAYDDSVGVSPMLQAAEESMDETQLLDNAVFIGERVRVSDRVFDRLLRMDPDDAAALSEQLNRLPGQAGPD